MSSLKVYKVISLPKVLEPNAIYLVAEKESKTVEIVVANKEGDGVLHSINETQIRSIIQDEFSSLPSKNRSFKKTKILFFFILLSIIFAIAYWLSIPKLASYKLKDMPIVQTIVASGQVEQIPHTEVKSTISGIVREVKVKEGENVSSKNVLLELQPKTVDLQIKQLETELNALSQRRKQLANLESDKAKIQLSQAKAEANRHIIPLVSEEEAEVYQAAYRVAEKNSQIAELQKKHAAQSDLEEVKLRIQLATLNTQLVRPLIHAEVNGTVLSRNVESGDLVMPDKTLFTIASEGNTKIKVQVNERHISIIKPQQNVKVVTGVYPDQPFSATIHYISPIINTSYGTVDVWLNVNKAPTFLRQNMPVSVYIQTGRPHKALVISNDALSNVHNNKADVVVVRNGKILHKNITLGLRGLTITEVVSGLKVDDQVIVNSSLQLEDGARIRTIDKQYPTLREW